MEVFYEEEHTHGSDRRRPRHRGTGRLVGYHADGSRYGGRGATGGSRLTIGRDREATTRAGAARGRHETRGEDDDCA